MKSSLSLFLGLAVFATSCNSHKKSDGNASRTASFSIGGLNVPAGSPSWNLLKLSMTKKGTETPSLAKDYAAKEFKDSKLNDITIKVEYGRYTIAMQYLDNASRLVYQSCPEEKTREHVIEQPSYTTSIKICAEGSTTPVGQVDVKPSAEVTITPSLEGGQDQQQGTGGPALTSGTCKTASGETLQGHDNVLGQCIDQKTSWAVQNGEVTFQGQAFPLKGINWFGLDTADNKLHGLWSGRSMDSFLDQIKDLGFTALRIPVSPQTLTATGPVDGYASSLEQLKALLAGTGKRKIAVLLDLHTCNVKAGHLTGTPEAPECAGYKKQNWLNDLKALAALSKSYPYVAGIDLYNEPYRLSWATWRSWASEAATVVLKENPRILTFIEGVGSAEGTPYGQYAPFFGENLFEALSKPVDVPHSRLVFSPHAYGPSVFAEHDYFKSSAFPSNMPGIWDEHFGYLRDKGYAIAPGEFGGRYVGADKQWQDAFVSYLVKKKIKNFFYWSLNPNSGDTGGLLNDDWKTVNQEKLNLLKPLLQ